MTAVVTDRTLLIYVTSLVTLGCLKLKFIVLFVRVTELVLNAFAKFPKKKISSVSFVMSVRLSLRLAFRPSA